MRCRSCGTTWSLECGLGPGGAAAPGQAFVLGVVLGAAAALVAVKPHALGGDPLAWHLVAGLLAALALVPFVIALSGAGWQEPSTAYQGSECPGCKTRNWIWPWSF